MSSPTELDLLDEYARQGLSPPSPANIARARRVREADQDDPNSVDRKVMADQLRKYRIPIVLPDEQDQKSLINPDDLKKKGPGWT